MTDAVAIRQSRKLALLAHRCTPAEEAAGVKRGALGFGIALALDLDASQVGEALAEPAVTGVGDTRNGK